MVLMQLVNLLKKLLNTHNCKGIKMTLSVLETETTTSLTEANDLFRGRSVNWITRKSYKGQKVLCISFIGTEQLLLIDGSVATMSDIEFRDFK